MSRVRVVQYIVQPVLVLDDGEDLSPMPPIQPITVPAAAWCDFVDHGLTAALAAFQSQQDASAPDGEQTLD